jgi:hypothetical protein
MLLEIVRVVSSLIIGLAAMPAGAALAVAVSATAWLLLGALLWTASQCVRSTVDDDGAVSVWVLVLIVVDVVALGGLTVSAHVVYGWWLI